jgi:hypothetical protein
MKRSISPLMWFYLFCSLCGLLVPWYFNLTYILQSPVPFTIAEMWRQGTAAPLAASLTYDFLIAASAGFAFMWIEMVRLRMSYKWFFFVVTFLIAFAFAFPLFLFFRELKLQHN